MVYKSQIWSLEIKHSSLFLVGCVQQIITGVQSDMRLLVASIKDVEQITSLAASGVNSFAIPVPIIEKLFQDDDTDKAAADFEEAVSRTLVNAA